jgi:hypothetical protein
VAARIEKIHHIGSPAHDLPDCSLVEGYCESGNEHSGSLKCWEVPEWLSDRRLIKTDPAPWT